MQRFLAGLLQVLIVIIQSNRLKLVFTVRPHCLKCRSNVTVRY